MREIFRRVTNGDFEAYSSIITITEVLVQPFRQKNKSLADEYRNLLYNAANFKLSQINSSITETAARLRAKYNLRTPDALQIAAALENSCDAFLCNDKNLKRVTELKILILDELTL
jgi:predicted nucleic acid-binding protein